MDKSGMQKKPKTRPTETTITAEKGAKDELKIPKFNKRTT